MGKGKPRVKDDGAPEVPKKNLSDEDIKELNLSTDEQIPSVPQQNLSMEDIQQPNQPTVLTLWATFLPQNQWEGISIFKLVAANRHI